MSWPSLVILMAPVVPVTRHGALDRREGVLQ